MLVSQENGDGGRRQTPSGETRAAAARRGKASFLPSFAALKDRVAKACGGEEAWEAQVVAGVRAVLEFAAADPQAAHALTVEAPASSRRARSTSSRRRSPTSPACSARRSEVERRFTLSTEEALVESIATIIRGHLQLGTADELPGIAPDLVYITLMPYLGISEARRWAESSAVSGHSGT